MMTEEREKAKNVINELELYAEDLQYHSADEMKEALDMAIRAFEQQPCEDAISRQVVKEQMIKYGFHAPDMTVTEFVEDLPSISTEKIGQFARWVAEEIFDETWEYNKDAFAELACRKLEKLGIVRANGDKWELVEPMEGEE